MAPVDTGEWPHRGVLLGPTEVKKEPSSIFPVQIHDEDIVANAISKVAKALVDSMEKRARQAL